MYYDYAIYRFIVVVLYLIPCVCICYVLASLAYVLPMFLSLYYLFVWHNLVDAYHFEISFQNLSPPIH
jgi:hypothetical protein